MSDTIIVTGAAGFIGRNVVSALNERGMDDVLIVDALGTDEKWRNLVGLRYRDVLHKDEFLERVEDGDLPSAGAVIHLGACSATTETDADYLLYNNYRYTRRLCEACLEGGVRFIYASSAATYGDGHRGYSDDDAVIPTLEPLNMYGYSKQMFDLCALENGWFERGIVGLKYFNVYGPYEDHKGDMRSVVHKAYGQIGDTGKVRLFKSYRPDYADGEQQRDFIYVKEAVDKTLFFLDHADIGGLFNVGTGRARTWNDLIQAVFAALEREPHIEYIDMPLHLQEKYQYFTQAETAKLAAAGYDRPGISLEEGVRDYVTSYLMRRA